MTFTGNWLYDTFNHPLATAGHEGNFQAYVNTLTIPAGAAKSVLHYIVLGQRVTAATSADERLKVETTAASLVTAPDLTDLTPAQVCSVDNFALSCTGGGTIPRVPVPAAPKAEGWTRFGSLPARTLSRACQIAGGLWPKGTAP